MPGGSILGDFPWLTEVFPEYALKRRELVDLLFGGDEQAVLPGHIRELVAATSLAQRASPAFEIHAMRAIEAGASFRQVVEAFLVATVPGGNAVLLHAAPTLARIHSELGDDARRDEGGSTDDERGFRTARESGRPSWAVLDLYSETEGRRQSLAAMLWEPTDSAYLSVCYRELIAAPLFADRAYPTTKKHLKRAIQEGASIRECLEALVVAGHLIGWPIVNFALPILIELEAQLDEDS